MSDSESENTDDKTAKDTTEEPTAGLRYLLPQRTNTDNSLTMAKEKGSYGWTAEVGVLAARRWAHYPTLNRVVQEVATCDITKIAACQSAADSLRNVASQCPFGKETRFPETEVYVLIDGDTIVAKQILRCIHLLARDNRDNEVRGHPEATDRVRNQQKQDQNRALSVALSELSTLVGFTGNPEKESHNGIFWRGSFEDKFALTWTPKT